MGLDRHPEGAGDGLVFNIQRFSLHDGSGIRTLVFLSGCPLRCRWCSNPEGQTCAPQLAYDANKCIGRQACAAVCQRACPVGAIRATDGGTVCVDLAACTGCGDCVPVCPPRALERFGKRMGVEEVLEAVHRDGAFFARSGGGLTLSGGEPLVQAEFAARLLEAARARGIGTAVETSGCAPWRDLERVCRHTDELFYDLKCLDSEQHRSGTGVGNELILDNLRRLREELPELPLVVRTPIVPGFNDAPEDVRAVCDFLTTLPPSVRYQLLAYHRFGEPKYAKLGREYPLPGVETPSAEQMVALRRVVGESGLSG